MNDLLINMLTAHLTKQSNLPRFSYLIYLLVNCVIRA